MSISLFSYTFLKMGKRLGLDCLLASTFIFKSTSKAVALFVLNYIKVKLKFKHYSRMKLFIEEMPESCI